MGKVLLLSLLIFSSSLYAEQNTKQQKIDLQTLFATQVPEILKTLNWKKSMRWSNHSLSWGRPLKSILCLFDKHLVVFDFHHLPDADGVDY